MGPQPARPPPPWKATLLTQLSLCLALYLAFRITTLFPKSDSRVEEVHFLSVAGGWRPADQHARLLRLMEKMAITHKVEFVINVSELGDDDPLLLNGTWRFSSMKVPWYTTRISLGQATNHPLKQIHIRRDAILGIIGMDTGPLHASMDQLSKEGRDQLNWLKQTLEVSDARWRIIVGFHPFLACEELNGSVTMKKAFQSTHNIFVNYGVNAYLSRHECCDLFRRKGGVAYIGNPHSGLDAGMQDGILLHRISPLEFASYFIDASGKLITKAKHIQRGREAM